MGNKWATQSVQAARNAVVASDAVSAAEQEKVSVALATSGV
jgi:hypothetical protein